MTVDIEQLPAVVDCVAAMQPGSPRVFDHWADNAYITSNVVEGNPQVLASAPVRVRRQFRMNRQATVPLECRGVLAYWDHRLERARRLSLDPGRPGEAASGCRASSACPRTRCA